MTKKLTSIQKQVQFNARDDSLDLTTATNLAIVNEVYRELANMFEWPEFFFTGTLTATTLEDTEEYAWTGTGFPTFMDVKTVEIESPSHDPDTVDDDVFNTSTVTAATSRSTWKLIHKPPNEMEWNLAGRRTSVVTPLYYRRNDDGTNNKISFRPTPSTEGYAIQVTGMGEPTALTGGTSTTEFITNAADDAFAHMIAVAFAARDGMNDIAQLNQQKAMNILSIMFSKEQVTEEKTQ